MDQKQYTKAFDLGQADIRPQLGSTMRCFVAPGRKAGSGILSVAHNTGKGNQNGGVFDWRPLSRSIAP